MFTEAWRVSFIYALYVLFWNHHFSNKRGSSNNNAFKKKKPFRYVTSCAIQYKMYLLVYRTSKKEIQGFVVYWWQRAVQIGEGVKESHTICLVCESADTTLNSSF
jgi:hypothetical protein